MKLGGGSTHYTCKMEEGGGQALVHRGWRRGGFAPLENEKRKGKYRPISAVRDK